jgi:hypothetical protein
VLWLAGIAAGVLLLLAVPVDVAFAVRRRERARVTVAWLWGRMRLPVPTGPAKPKAPKPKKKRKERRRPRVSGGRRALAVLRTPDFPRRALRLVGDLRRCVRIRRLELALRLGTGDPADTGRLWGLVGPAAALVPVPPGAHVEVSPAFEEAVFDLDGRGEVRVVPAAVLAVVAGFLLSPTALRAGWAAARGAP